MIEILDKMKCSGCGACIQVCPKRCITLVEDREGFEYPEVDGSNCIACGRCERVCPALCKLDVRTPLSAFAAKNVSNAVRLQSSSGGIFSAIAEYVLQEGGVVFGAAYNRNFEVYHRSVDSLEDLALLRSSKYVQSRTGETFREAKVLLKQGRLVLYSGTPCQIAGLKKYLGKDYENLLAVEIFCHGVPSPKIWRMTLKELKSKLSSEKNGRADLVSMNFRDKVSGWKDYSCSIGFHVAWDKAESADLLRTMPTRSFVYLQGFLHHLYLRPSCHRCFVRQGRSGCDISIGDYWQAVRSMPDFDDNKGISAVVVYTQKGEVALQHIEFEKRRAEFSDIQKDNGAFVEIIPVHPKREYFFDQLNNNESLDRLILKCIRPNLLVRVKQKIERTMKQLRK